MTREEIVKSISVQDAIQVLQDTNTYGTADIAKSVILKALEQEQIIDKIRAEIEKLPNMDEAGVFSSIRMKRMVLEIIDKYKAESEKTDT